MTDRLPAVIRDALAEARINWGGDAPGQCRLVKDGRELVVARADPVVWLEDAFLHTLRKNQKMNLTEPGMPDQAVMLTWGPYDVCDPKTCCQMFKDGPCFRGAILEIDAKNTKVFYTVGRYLRRGVWEATQL